MKNELDKIVEKYRFTIDKSKLRETIILLVSEREELIEMKTKEVINIEQLKNELNTIENVSVSEIFDILNDRPENGSFYTPICLAELIGRLALELKLDVASIYDNSIGMAGLLMPLIKVKKDIKIYGRDINKASVESLKGILEILNISNDIEHGNTLEVAGQKMKVDMSIVNPPYGVRYDKNKINVDYFEYLPKATDSTLLFLQDALKYSDKVIAVVPVGMLFQGGAVEKWRKNIIQNGWLDTVIQLPEKLFANTTIPVAIMIIDKTRDGTDKALIVYAAEKFKALKKQNKLSDEDISSIVHIYRQRVSVDKVAELVSTVDIEENDFNLNISRYVDYFTDEEIIDINEVNEKLVEINREILEIEKVLIPYYKELGLNPYK